MNSTQIDEILDRQVEQILPDKASLRKLLISDKKIRIYQGFDPTGGQLHLGHTIGMRNLQKFANLGHEVFVLFGTGTVLVGDPSERDTGRKLITPEEIDANIADWKNQVRKVIDLDRVTIKHNGDWLTSLTLKDIIHIASNISAVQLFKRDSFQRRIDKGDTVWFHETLYPLLQGYDSVVMDVDLEIGGTDQTFNMLVGRELQRKINNREKFVLTTPMILGTNGQQMSKTSGNCIWLNDSANDMYGKVMSITDDQVHPYWQLLTNMELVSQDQINQDPLKHKKALAFDIARQFHGQAQALKAQQHFQDTIQQGQIPDSIPTLNLTNNSLTLLELCAQAQTGDSNSQIKRLIKQGGAKINHKQITDPTAALEIKDGDVLQYGKRTFFRLTT